MKKQKYSAFIVPTGVGAEIGGFAGDAGRFASKISKEFPLIVNPNVVNAACFSSINENMLYVEGYALTEFFKGNISLKLSKNNKIGVIFDKAVSKDVLNVHINTVTAVKTVYDIDVIGYEISSECADVEFFTTENGLSSGRINNPDTLVDAGKKLLSKGADVLAVVCKFDEAEEDNYSDGEGVDVIGGAEALISHYLSKKLHVPVVHAPAFDDYQIKPDLVHPKAAAEFITPTFLPCLLFGLQNAPLIVDGHVGDAVNIKDVEYLIMPYDSLGSSVVTNALNKGIKVLAVENNKTVLNANSSNLGLDDVIIKIKSYDDCLEYMKKALNEK